MSPFCPHFVRQMSGRYRDRYKDIDIRYRDRYKVSKKVSIYIK